MRSVSLYSIIVPACLLVILFSLAMPASAGISDIPSGGTVFIGEQGLDVTATGLSAGDEIGWWGQSGTPGSTPAQEKVTVSDPSDFYVSPSSFAGHTGPWFTTSGKKLVFYARDPTLTLRIIDESRDFDASGQWVPRGDQVGFRIETNMIDMAKRPGVAGAPVTITIQTPDGAESSMVYDAAGNVKSMVDLPVATSPYSTNFAWNTGNSVYKSGTYTIWAKGTANSINDNYDVTGKTITPKDATGQINLQVANPRILATSTLPDAAATTAATEKTLVPTVVQTRVTVVATSLPTPEATAVLTTPAPTLSPTTPAPAVTRKTPGFTPVLTGLSVLCLLLLMGYRRH